MMDFIADIALATEEPTVKAPRAPGGPKWYTTHSSGWAPEADDVTLAPRPLAACNANQVPSLVYASVIEVEAEMAGAKLYFPLFGVLWEYRGTFLSHGGARYYMVEALGKVDGCGIAVGSVWSAEAARFRRVA